jgi:hypothetical protein
MLVKIDGSGEYFGEHPMNQHYPIVYQDVKKELLELCRLSKIRSILDGNMKRKKDSNQR